MRVIFALPLLMLTACAAPQPQISATPPRARPANLGVAPVVAAPAAPDSAAYFRDHVGDTVVFVANETTLSAQARARLVAQAAWLAAHPRFRATIEGHAAERGTREYNLALGARRANAVQEYLVAQGVAPERLRITSFGKERPAAVCSTEDCLAANRRAVTVVVAQEAGA